MEGGQVVYHPFSQNDYNGIFKVSLSNSNIVVSRESTTLEFKESFSSDVLNRCMRTIAGFANNEGGYIVFGIKDKPHELIGLNLKAEERFDSLDPAKLTDSINNHFAPSIRIELQKYVFCGKSYGIMYVYQSLTKPVICLKSEGEMLRESAIYYRYRGQTREIRYSELRQIIDQLIEKNNMMWQETFRRISRIGVENLALINTVTGDLSIDSRNFLIDQNLMSKLNYIEEGRFVEADGAPTLKLVGTLKTLDGTSPVISNTKVVTKTGIRSENIVKDFLTQSKVDNPIDYIEQTCFESSSYLPIYYYIKLSELTMPEVLNRLDEVRSRSQTKKKVIDRLNNHPSLYLPNRHNESQASMDKDRILHAIMNNTYEPSDEIVQIRYFCQVVRSMSKDELHEHFSLINQMLLEYYQRYYLDRYFKYMDDMRKAICHIDYELYAEND